MLPSGVDDREYGPFALHAPMPFPMGSAETSYYVSSNGYVSFSLGNERMITATYGDLVTPPCSSSPRMYHACIRGTASQLQPLWSDVMSTLPFSPSYALVFTVDRGLFFRASGTVTSQTSSARSSTITRSQSLSSAPSLSMTKSLSSTAIATFQGCLHRRTQDHYRLSIH
ncbi:Hypothetical protein, putative [Bodo saltans]|uniref:Uncharacterized protein n=1 Tax=Bodo saltans TaxID=75058 RepID=A0A0S4JXF4_BODSA|nr:Hypothetical protein, putative [Bodo saltans]|eukprot:CUG93261.1 Hypothetical protein, putative [Bodo saltans]